MIKTLAFRSQLTSKGKKAMLTSVFENLTKVNLISEIFFFKGLFMKLMKLVVFSYIYLELI